MHWSNRIRIQDARQFISLLENQLVKLHRAAIPLFHPDRYHVNTAEANQLLKTFCHRLICQYQNFIGHCQKKLEDRKQDIFKIETQRKEYEKRNPNTHLSWSGLWQQLENIEKGIKAFDEKMEKTDAKLKNHEARIQALFRKRQKQRFYQSHRIFKLNRSKLPVLKEELEGENASVIFNK